MRRSTVSHNAGMHNTLWRLAFMFGVIALPGCSSPTSPADHLTLAIPDGYIGSGSSVVAAVINDGDDEVAVGSLPCVIGIERRVDAEWVAYGSLRLCTDEVVKVPARGAREALVEMPGEIGTWRLTLTVTSRAGPFTVRSRSFQTVGIVVN